MANYQFKIFKTIRVSDSQELLIGTVWLDGYQYVGIRERVPGTDVDTSKGTYFPSYKVEEVREALSELEEFLTGGRYRSPGPGQGSLL